MGERSSITETEAGCTGSDARSTFGAVWAGNLARGRHVIDAFEPNASRSAATLGWIESDTAVVEFGVNGTRPSQGFTSSFHTGGVNVGLADSSTHFINESISFDVLIALSVMADGQVVSIE